ncbi:hypothetical protein [Streptomyces sp. NPDC026673]|uniref:hypothetical protein n=1 Tax=Streptomyces sp. NPDC026673 TaxID=3155724 RepID=UPI0033D41F03
MAALLLGFAVDVGLLGHVRHARDQQVDYAALRGDLADGIAPVGGSGEGVKPLTSGSPGSGCARSSARAPPRRC